MSKVQVRNIPPPAKPKLTVGVVEQRISALLLNTRSLFEYATKLAREFQNLRDQLGSIVTQDLDAVDIDGGAIDGTVIGANSAAAATITTLNVTGDVNHDGSNVGFFSKAPASQGTHITDATTSHSLTGSDTINVSTLDTAMDALGTKINLLIDFAERHGLSATS